MIKIISLLICFFTFYTSTAFSENIWVIHAGNVLVTPGEEPLKKRTIVIQDNLIERNEKGKAYKSGNHTKMDERREGSCSSVTISL